ncbi:hypothetical protein EK904_010587, partial [Melospiza melodia maxima]
MCEVVENIKDLLDKEPRDRLSSKIRYLAMITIEELSLVENVLEGKTKILLSACFSSVLLLPSEKEMPHQNTSLYIKTLKAMDTMLRTVVLSFPASSISEELQDIFQMLLEYTRFEREAVRERAVGRIAVLTNLLSNYSTLKAFGRYLHSSERTDVVLEVIEAMKDPSILDKDVPCSMLDVIMEDTDFWVTDVPKTVKCIFENLLYTTTEAGSVKVESLFLLMTTQHPSAVVISLCEMALQGDSTSWLCLFLQSSLGQVDLEELGEEPNIWSNQGNPNVMTAFLMLEVLLGLSERMEMGKKIEAFLPSMMKILEVGSEDEKLKIIEVFRNVLSQLKKSKASSMAVALVGKILPLFDS